MFVKKFPKKAEKTANYYCYVNQNLIQNVWENISNKNSAGSLPLKIYLDESIFDDGNEELEIKVRLTGLCFTSS